MTSWTEYQDDISIAISDSMDVDWSASVGARAVVAWLNEHKPLSAAPAPEGVAVDARTVAKILNPALFSHDKVEAHRAASPHTVTSARIDAVDDVRRVLDAAALATREEAPAEAGDRQKLIDDLRYVYSQMTPSALERMDSDGAAAVIERAIDYVRAQPQAREEAQ